jgi:hypothetical protein
LNVCSPENAANMFCSQLPAMSGCITTGTFCAGTLRAPTRATARRAPSLPIASGDLSFASKRCEVAVIAGLLARAVVGERVDEAGRASCRDS